MTAWEEFQAKLNAYDEACLKRRIAMCELYSVSRSLMSDNTVSKQCRRQAATYFGWLDKEITPAEKEMI